jgi:hypothetical protein
MKPRAPLETSGLELLERAFSLLRAAPATTLLCFYLGALPFVGGLLYFWADMSADAFADDDLVPASLGLALLFIWMKCWHSLFMNGLQRQLSGAEPRPWTLARGLRLVLTQTLLQPWALIGRPIAAVITFPYPWVRAYFENALLLGDGLTSVPEARAASLRYARLAVRQNCLLLSILFLFSIFVWANIASAAILLPTLLKTFLGVQSMFTRDLYGLLNTTLLMTTFAMTYLCTNPLLKAVYTLRCYQGAAQSTGQDLRVMLRRLRGVAAAALALFLFSESTGLRAETTPPPAPAAVAPARLNQSIDDVLTRREFAWRLPRQENAERPGWLSGLFDGTNKMLKRFGHWLSDLLERLGKLLFKNYKPTPKPATPSGWSLSKLSEIVRIVVIGLTVLIVILLAGLIWRRLRQKPLVIRAVEEAVAATPDLTSENVTADQLPEDGWLKLAREMQESGQFRLALRALYLAELAHLGARKFISIARHKSNRDYETELARRTRQQPEIAGVFRNSRGVFERCWYGLKDVTPAMLGEFHAEVERIRAC